MHKQQRNHTGAAVLLYCRRPLRGNNARRLHAYMVGNTSVVKMLEVALRSSSSSSMAFLDVIIVELHAVRVREELLVPQDILHSMKEMEVVMVTSMNEVRRKARSFCRNLIVQRMIERMKTLTSRIELNVSVQTVFDAGKAFNVNSHDASSVDMVAYPFAGIRSMLAAKGGSNGLLAAPADELRSPQNGTDTTMQLATDFVVPLSWDEVAEPARGNLSADPLYAIRFYVKQCQDEVTLKDGRKTHPLKDWRTMGMYGKIRTAVHATGMTGDKVDKVIDKFTNHVTRRLRIYNEWLGLGSDYDMFKAKYGTSMSSFLKRKPKQ